RHLTPPLLPSFPTRRSSDLHGALLQYVPAADRFVQEAEHLVKLVHYTHPPSTGITRFPEAARRRTRSVAAPPPRRQPRDWRSCLDRKSTRLNSSHLGISYAV